MRLCDEIHLWNRIIPSLNLPCIAKKSRSPYKEIPKDLIKVTVDENGRRTVSHEKQNLKNRFAKKVSYKNRRKDQAARPTQRYDRDTVTMGKHNMGTQANCHDLEFLITDPTFRGQHHETENISDKLLYKRETESRRQYQSRFKTLDINGHIMDSVSVQITDLSRKGSPTEIEDEKEETKENDSDSSEERRSSGLNSEDDGSGKFSDIPEPVPVPRRHKMTSKPSEFKFTMIRVGGGWMELPDYLRHHIPKHVYEKQTCDDINFVIRSQRPRSVSVSKQKDLFSWASTLSRATKGLYIRSTAKFIYGREKLRKKEKPGWCALR